MRMAAGTYTVGSSLTKVLAQLGDESVPIRSLSLSYLSDLPRSETGSVRTAWNGFSAARRLELIGAMVEQADANIHVNFHAVLRECLNDADAQVRQLAVEGLWEDERPSLVGPLMALLQDDPAAEVQAAAATSLGRFVLKGALGEVSEPLAKQVEQALRTAWFRSHEVVGVRRRALESLAYGDDIAVYELIDSAYYDEDRLMRQSAVFAMGRTADRHWARFILAELASPEAAMRYEAAASAGELSLKAAVKPLVRLLDDTDGHVREAAAIALGKIGGPLARRALEFVAQGNDERLADAAGEALQELAFNVELGEDARAARRAEGDGAGERSRRAAGRVAEADMEPGAWYVGDAEGAELGAAADLDDDDDDEDLDWEDDDDAEVEGDPDLWEDDDQEDEGTDWDPDNDPDDPD